MPATAQDFRGLILKHWDAHDTVHATNLDLMEKVAGVSERDMVAAATEVSATRGRLIDYMNAHGLNTKEFEAEQDRLRSEFSKAKLAEIEKFRERKERVLAECIETEDEEPEDDGWEKE